MDRFAICALSHFQLAKQEFVILALRDTFMLILFVQSILDVSIRSLEPKNAYHVLPITITFISQQVVLVVVIRVTNKRRP